MTTPDFPKHDLGGRVEVPSTTSDRTTDPSPADVVARLLRFMPAYNGVDEGFGTAIMVSSKTGEWINRAAALYAAEAEAATLQARLEQAERERDAARDAAAFQERVAEAHIALFHDDPTDLAERRDRFYEEATEAAQALGMTEEEAHQLVAYTFGRPPGDVRKEIGAAVLTLASVCVVGGWDMMACAEADLAALRTPEKIAKVRAKRATRHGRGPLPGIDSAALAPSPADGAEKAPSLPVAWHYRCGEGRQCMTIPGSCRFCGCTQYDACHDDERDVCSWVEPDLCSHCADSVGMLGELLTGLTRHGTPSDRIEGSGPAGDDVGDISLPIHHARQILKVLERIDAAGEATGDPPACSRCGGPHPFDTSLPGETWNRLEPDGGYLCLSCIVADAARTGTSFTARLWGGDFNGETIAITVGPGEHG